jgi:ATP-binding cassette subfamily B protein RaxB
LLRRLDCTVVVITHDRSLAAMFDVRYRLMDGALLPEMPEHLHPLPEPVHV